MSEDVSLDIYNSIREDNWELLQSLLDENPDQLKGRSHIGTWLDCSAIANAIECTKVLLERGLDPNYSLDRDGSLPLWTAANEGHLKICEMLLEAGSKLDVSAPEVNPLIAASRIGNLDIVKLLLSSGIDATVRYGSKKGDVIANALIHDNLNVAEYIAEFLSCGNKSKYEELMLKGRMIVGEVSNNKVQYHVIPPIDG